MSSELCVESTGVRAGSLTLATVTEYGMPAVSGSVVRITWVLKVPSWTPVIVTVGVQVRLVDEQARAIGSGDAVVLRALGRRAGGSGKRHIDVRGVGASACTTRGSAEPSAGPPPPDPEPLPPPQPLASRATKAAKTTVAGNRFAIRVPLHRHRDARSGRRGEALYPIPPAGCLMEL